MARQIAWRWALVGFTLTLLRGQVLSVGFDATLRCALWSLVVAYGLGLTCGTIWRKTFE